MKFIFKKKKSYCLVEINLCDILEFFFLSLLFTNRFCSLSHADAEMTSGMLLNIFTLNERKCNKQKNEQMKETINYVFIFKIKKVKNKERATNK